MQAEHIEILNVRHVTNNQPFGAGIILMQDNCLLTTLNTNGLPQALAGDKAWRVGWAGGGQEQGETIWECALREAREELSADVTLATSAVTYFHDLDTGEIYPVTCTDTVAPFLLERQSNLYPYTPYRPGLPSGPYTYFGLFLAQLSKTTIQPGDEVEGLLFIPINGWSLLLQQPTLGTLLKQGARLVEQHPLPRTRQLWLHPHESFATVANLLEQHPELQVGE